MRKFEIVRKDAIEYDATDIQMPIRATLKSAGYDFFSPIEFTIEANGVYLIWTNIKAKMLDDEFLMLCTTSGMGKRGIKLTNSVGIVDADYYSNINNDGNIGFSLQNTLNQPYTFKKGEKIGQGIFMKFLPCTEDNVKNVERTGGYGSTDKSN